MYLTGARARANDASGLGTATFPYVGKNYVTQIYLANFFQYSLPHRKRYKKIAKISNNQKNIFFLLNYG